MFYTSPRTSSLRTRTDSPTPGVLLHLTGTPGLVTPCTGGTLHWRDSALVGLCGRWASRFLRFTTTLTKVSYCKTQFFTFSAFLHKTNEIISVFNFLCPGFREMQNRLSEDPFSSLHPANRLFLEIAYCLNSLTSHKL